MAKWQKSFIPLLNALALIATTIIAPQILCFVPNDHLALENIVTGCSGISEANCIQQASRPRENFSSPGCYVAPAPCTDILINHVAGSFKLFPRLVFQPAERPTVWLVIIDAARLQQAVKPVLSNLHLGSPLESKTTLLI